jgi:hypothetical protein
MKYKVIWHNAHACDRLPGDFNTKREAERAGREWKREMVAMEPTREARRDAREEYLWEVMELSDDLDDGVEFAAFQEVAE